MDTICKPIYSSKALKETECLQAENQALKVQLMSQLEDVQKENNDLNRVLDKMKCQSSHDEQVGMLLKKFRNSKADLKLKWQQKALAKPAVHARTPSTPVNCRIKVFNSIPKSLRDFYDQMENGKWN